jgi:phosphoglycerate dehydrogenase-like enzyme
MPPDHPLLSLENTVLTPHLGYVTERGFRAMYGQAVEDIAAFLGGTPVRVIE